MPTTTSITTTYAGEFAGKYIAAALLSAPTLDKGGITIMPNVKYKQVIKRVATDDIIKNATCDFDPTSTITLTERILQPESFQVNLQLCKSDFRSDWDAIQMGYSAFDVLPKSFADFLIAHAAEKVAAGMETSIWSGVNATAGQFAGIMTQLTTDASLPAAQEIAAVGGGVNAGNVIAELGKIVVLANGLASNTALLAQKSNLYFATGLLNDMNEVKVIDLADVDGSQNVRVVMRFTADAKYGFASDVVTYGITNSAN